VVRKVAACDFCPSGYYGSLQKILCVACARGTFGILEGENTFDAACTNCIAGRYSEIDGYDGASDVIPCVGCKAGYWSDKVGATKESACDSSSAGKYSSFITSATNQCEDCEKGRYLERVGANTPDLCKACPAGFSQDQKGQSYW